MSAVGQSRWTSSRNPVQTLVAAQFTNSLGDGAYYVTSILYFTAVVGLTPGQVGLGLSCAWGLGFLATTPLGHVADRVGLRRAAVTLALATAAGLVLLVTVQSFIGFVVAAALYAVAQSGLGAVRQALLVTLVAEQERVRARARLQVMLNAGLGLGAALGGLALAVGTERAYLSVLAGDAAAFVLAGLLLARLPRTTGAPRAERHTSLAVLRDRRFVTATTLNALLYFYMPVLSVLLPLWTAERTVAPDWVVGALFVLNTLGVVAMQGRAAQRVTDLMTAAHSIRWGGALLGVACVVLSFSASAQLPLTATVVLLLGGLVLVAGEVLVAAGSWETGFALADPQHPGQWQGFFSSGIPAARAVGPLALLALVVDWSGPGWYVLGAAFALAGLALGRIARRAQRVDSEPAGTGAGRSLVAHSGSRRVLR